MKSKSKTRFINDVEVPSNRLKVRKPFRIQRDNQRRYIRLEISTPMDLRMVKDDFGNFLSAQQDYEIHGEILNISAGGVLADLEQPLNENDIVALRFCLQDVETIENVLGFVKRVDGDNGSYLTGIEFVGKQQLEDRFSGPELEFLSDSFGDFDSRVEEVLNNYLFSEVGAGNE
ncbi:MAG: PilZ domain-containing protein [candidate division Zixibacteria bacterium]|nr:PilZ domain-containing protein [candidate division Zixibacteria bacterium]